MNAKQIAAKHGMLSEGEVELIHECAKLLTAEKPVIVNIGAGFGTSTLAFLEARPTAFIFEIDVVERPLALEHTKDHFRQIARVRGRSQFVGINWPYPVDCVFVDGDHGDKAVAGDIEAWLPKLISGGIVLFHDYKHPNVPGLTVVVDEYMNDEYEHIGENRFLVAFRKNQGGIR